MVTVRCFARVREVLGQDTLPFPLAPDQRVTAREVLAAVAQDRLLDLPQPLLVAVNRTHASWDSLVQDGDEVAFFPPVSGG